VQASDAAGASVRNALGAGVCSAVGTGNGGAENGAGAGSELLTRVCLQSKPAIPNVKSAKRQRRHERACFIVGASALRRPKAEPAVPLDAAFEKVPFDEPAIFLLLCLFLFAFCVLPSLAPPIMLVHTRNQA
jgi:hypothetical protein